MNIINSVKSWQNLYFCALINFGLWSKFFIHYLSPRHVKCIVMVNHINTLNSLYTWFRVGGVIVPTKNINPIDYGWALTNFCTFCRTLNFVPYFDIGKLMATLFSEWYFCDNVGNYIFVISNVRVVVNSSPPGQNGRHFAADTFKCIFMNENPCILIQISLKFVPKGPIDNIPALVQVMAWRRTGDKPLPEAMLTRFTDAYMRH